MKIDIYGLLEKVRNQRPVVHHLTNWVTIYDCANIVKVFGASPVMAHAKEEVADMAKIASALVLNIGTLTIDFIEAMKLAAKSANEKGIPVVLDVCGAGATKLRDEKCFELLDEVKISIIKGNSSEVARIAGENVQTKGVDATAVEKNLIEIAEGLAEKRKCTVVITGKEDVVSDGKKALLVKNGCEMMSNIVGTGCMAASVIGTFAAVENDLAVASASGLCCFEIAAEIAVKLSKGPGTFKEKLYDSVFYLDKKTIEKMRKIESL
ncbi:MAG: hydroxyethylthiazole kinase [Elusimicrobia bacterium CG06_land_8_20_14_3_00_38_11]|nr:MAG: hydroxyethylthiazole kinase [Elusimicrobia bacterium CG06_land_8_20_14_3_00_38_11]